MMLGVTVGFWIQKNYLNKENINELTDKMTKPITAKGEEQKASGDKNDFITSNKNKKMSGINFVLLLSMFFITFYIVAIYYSFKAYKEFKGTGEDLIGVEGMQRH